MLSRFTIILGIIFLLTNCSFFGFGSKGYEKSPEELMREGLSAFNEGDYSEALEYFQKVKDRYPYSKLSTYAELKLADTLLKRDELDEALEAYRDFERLHPKNKSVPYVIYQQGMCYFLRINSIDRDQTNTKNALKEFKRLEKQFPKSQYAIKAKRNIRKCLVNLAEHEFYIGQFYFKAGHYHAALRRFEYLIAHYPDLGQYGKSLKYIAICKKKLSEKESPE